MGVGIGATMAWRRVRADWIGRREDAVIYRAGFSNEAGSLALRLWDQSNSVAHIGSKLRSAARRTGSGIIAFEFYMQDARPVPLCCGTPSARPGPMCEAFSARQVVVGEGFKLNRDRSVALRALAANSSELPSAPASDGDCLTPVPLSSPASRLPSVRA